MKNGFAIEEKKDVELTPEQVSIIYSDMPDDDPLKQKHVEYMSRYLKRFVIDIFIILFVVIIYYYFKYIIIEY